jgi:hypothetical protein
MNEITDNDEVIGILFKVDEFEQRRGYLYLHPAQFDKLMGNLAASTCVTLYSRQGTQSECDLIISVHTYTKVIAPQQSAGRDALRVAAAMSTTVLKWTAVTAW